ncbi:MAG: ATP-binding protein [Intestinibacter bartlettii]|nr:ATP-binding protein [Intestinibacter bartlettii]
MAIEYQCEKCRDLGYTLQEDKEGYTQAVPCECIKKRQIKEKLERCGLTNSFKKKTFLNFKTDTEHQKQAKLRAMSYCKKFKEEKGSFLLTGKPGTGKTHLGIAMMMQLVNQNVGCRYAEYVSLIMKLKQCCMDPINYNKEIEQYKNCTVLFVDDLLKGQTSEADRKYIYEIINYRYMTEKPIIVSTEKSLDELMNYDAAITSRIIEMCRENIIEFKNVPNMRITKGV